MHRAFRHSLHTFAKVRGTNEQARNFNWFVEALKSLYLWTDQHYAISENSIEKHLLDTILVPNLFFEGCNVKEINCVTSAHVSFSVGYYYCCSSPVGISPKHVVHPHAVVL